MKKKTFPSESMHSKNLCVLRKQICSASFRQKISSNFKRILSNELILFDASWSFFSKTSVLSLALIRNWPVKMLVNFCCCLGCISSETLNEKITSKAALFSFFSSAGKIKSIKNFKRFFFVSHSFCHRNCCVHFPLDPYWRLFFHILWVFLFSLDGCLPIFEQN